MSWKEPAERHSDALIEAIEAAAHRIATAILEGFKSMADPQAQALADLTAAITNIGTAIAAEISALQTALAAGGVNDSPAIEAAVTNLNALTASLTASLPPAATPAAAPATPGH
jgi:hypothetical protein